MGQKGKIGVFLFLAGLVCMLCACDPLTRYKVASTVFDGVPHLPPPEQYCKDYHNQATAREREEEAKKKAERKDSGSIHPPYAMKRCNGCHDKNSESGFVAPKEKLCEVCHQNFIKGSFGHGPAIVGSCLSCHVPHEAKFPRLLKFPKEELCQSCHHEARMTRNLHDIVAAKKIVCSDCHDPHSGNRRYFLK